MAQPHHFVFNELSRAISKGIPIVPLVDALIEKGIIKDADKKKYTGRSGMNFLSAYLRNRDFKTFVQFVECIGKVEKLKPTAVSLVESIFKALQTYDKEHGSSFAEEIVSLKEVHTPTEVEIPTQAEGTTTLVSTEHQPEKKQSPKPAIPTAVEQMPGILKESISNAVVDTSEHNLSSFPYGYEIAIPAGAVLGKEPISLEVGVSTHGLYKLPVDCYRITDFLCVFASGEFQSPVTVSLSHCLECPEYTQMSSIVVLRADMDDISENGEYQFRQLNLQPEFSATDSTLSFELKKFCVLCAAYNFETTKPRSYERQGSSTDSVDATAAHLVRQVAIDDPSSEGTAPQSPKTDRDGPYRARVGSGSVPSAFKKSTEDEENPQLTSSGELFIPKTKIKQKRSSKRGTQAPYHPRRRSTKPSVQYKLMLCEPNHVSKRSFDIHIYACLDCPGSTQACMIQSKDHKITTQEFCFESDKIEFQVINPASGWSAKPKVSPASISKRAIQRYESDGAAAAMVEMGQYPPKREFTITLNDPTSLSSTDGDMTVCQVRVTHGSDSLVCEFNITCPQLPPLQDKMFSSVPMSHPISPLPWQQYPSGAPYPYYADACPGYVDHQGLMGTMPPHPMFYGPPNPSAQALSMNPVSTHPTMPWTGSHYPSTNVSVPVLQPTSSTVSSVPPTSLKNLTSDRLQRTLSNEQKESLSKQVDDGFILNACKHVMKWKMLGRHLGLDNAKIEQLDLDHKNDSKEAAYNMLRDWAKMNYGNATYQVLLDALLEAEEAQAIQYIVEYVS